MKFGRCWQSGLGAFLLVALTLSTGCQKSESEPSAAISDVARKEAKEIFAGRCTACHGPEGRGDGPASAGLTPKPANFHDTLWQNGVNDQHIETIIQFGGAAVGKSPAMPSNPDLTSKAEVVAALREHIRGLAN